ncbi:putative transporter [Cyphellophora attinorum]|uniref:Putative transporter n=1 Tax=Cyphellophora attinorum TaxID=1664694 RepID=A0A0N1HMC9_9EURO|nr:putative transporter [Phialophora attinorum]KPI38400.1 putative transporter [Phialophora attinorum]
MPLSDFLAWTAPTSFRLREAASSLVGRDQVVLMNDNVNSLNDHSGHPDFGHLTLLVFSAVLEVVCVSLPGYIIARSGMFDAEAQKFLANLNVNVFTPCLVFTKLASQLSADKLADLAIIPVIFAVQTIVSYVCAIVMGKMLRFKKRQQNFLIAMGVFGNSNSLPISLVISLSKTLKGLHWDKIPGDNDDEVAARGILYLLIFQQLGQLVRWSWGYNVLLAPPEAYTEAEGGTKDSVEAGFRDEDGTDDEHRRLLADDRDSVDSDDLTQTSSPTLVSNGVKTPTTPYTKSGLTSRNVSNSQLADNADVSATPANGNIAPTGYGETSYEPFESKRYDEEASGLKGSFNFVRNLIRGATLSVKRSVSSSASKGATKAFRALPLPLQKGLSTAGRGIMRFLRGLRDFMNPPLYAMVIAIIVASIPPLQDAFFHKGTFLRNSVTRAIEQSGGVAVPLILVVLGANLARNTLPKDPSSIIADPTVERKLLIASMVSRMLIPTLVMAPMIALMAKYVPISIVDDKIFVIVCFLLSGAPTALQLAQICQINNVYMPVMAKILFQSYVVWILPSTLLLVMLALETVEWATQGT